MKPVADEKYHGIVCANDQDKESHCSNHYSREKTKYVSTAYTFLLFFSPFSYPLSQTISQAMLKHRLRHQLMKNPYGRTEGLQ